MPNVDRIILLAIASELWALFLQNLTTPLQAEEQRSRRSIENIIEGCRVTGEVYLYSEDYGEIEGARGNVQGHTLKAFEEDDYRRISRRRPPGPGDGAIQC